MTNPERMRQYLYHAMKMEQNAYALRQSLRRVLSDAQEIQNLLADSTQRYEEIQNSLQTINVHDMIASQKSERSKALRLPVIGLIACLLYVLFAIGLIAIGLWQGEGTDALFVGCVNMAIDLLILLPIVISSLIRRLRKYARHKKDAERIYAGEHQYLLRAQGPAKREVDDYSQRYITYGRTAKELRADLHTTTQNLSDLYAKNLLPAIYRNFVAVSTMYGYLATGRCTTVEGHGGIYDTYERDMQVNRIITKLDEISDKLDVIRENQHDLYMAVQRGNEVADGIYRETVRIANSNERTAKNTAIIAAHQRQIEDHLAYERYWA